MDEVKEVDTDTRQGAYASLADSTKLKGTEGVARRLNKVKGEWYTSRLRSG